MKDPAMFRYLASCFDALLTFGHTWARSAADRDIAHHKATIRHAKREREAVTALATSVQTAAAELRQHRPRAPS